MRAAIAKNGRDCSDLSVSRNVTISPTVSVDGAQLLL